MESTETPSGDQGDVVPPSEQEEGASEPREPAGSGGEPPAQESAPDPDGGFDSPQGETRSGADQEDGIQTFSADELPSDASTWPEFRKFALTRATKIDGPFRVETSEGSLTCEDGYLALDARGYPYPIATDEFARIYQPAEQADGIQSVLRDLEREGNVAVIVFGTTAVDGLEDRISQLKAQAHERDFADLGSRQAAGS